MKFSLQVGHAGTLDPMATGLLIVCVGKATKIVERLSSIFILMCAFVRVYFFFFQSTWVAKHFVEEWLLLMLMEETLFSTYPSTQS